MHFVSKRILRYRLANKDDAQGLAIGVVTAIAGSCTPFAEWTADHVPERRMGVFGVGLILIGFTLQSVQYWLALLNVVVR